MSSAIKLLAPLLLLGLAAPAHAQVGPSTDKPGTWMSQFAAGAPGKDVAIICDKTGVWAYADGWKLPIDKTVASWCVADPYGQVVWMLVGTNLRVLDLAAPPGKTTVVVKKWPMSAEGDPVAVDIAYGKRRVGNASYNDAFHVFLEVPEARTSLSLDNFYYNVEEKDRARMAKRMRIRNAKLLRQLATRAKAVAWTPPASTCTDKRKDIPAANCEEEDACGGTEAIPGTPYCRVLVEQSCGDGCYLGFAFYDTSSGGYLYGFKPGGENAKIPFSSSSTLLVSPSGKHVIAGGAIVDWKKVVIAKGAAGWVAPGARLHGD